jgi:alpha-N-acetylglucosamine transferase
LHKKSFLFGFGTALLVMSALLYFAYIIQINIYKNNYEAELERAREIGYSWDQLIERATEQGMVFPNEVICRVCEDSDGTE